MKKDRFEIVRPADDLIHMPARLFAVDANEYVPDDQSRAVKLTLWQGASGRTGHVVMRNEFNLSRDERRSLVAFLQSLPDA